MTSLGAHVSISGGLHTAFEKAKALGCTCMQIFTRNNLQWKARPITAEARRLFLSERLRHAINPVVAHTNYMINLASPLEETWKKSLNCFFEEIQRVIDLEIPYLVLHPGNHMGSGEESGESSVALALNMAFERYPSWKGQVLLETTAGQGTSLGYTFQGLRRISDAVTCTDRVGFCLDSCHIFAAGYDIRSAQSYKRTMAEFGRCLGFDRLHVVHLNDSKGELAKRIDRHDHIGKGALGLDVFRHFLHDRRLENVHFIIETPKGKNRKETDYDDINLKILRSLIPPGGSALSANSVSLQGEKKIVSKSNRERKN